MVKRVGPIPVASVYGVVPSVVEFGDTFDRLFSILEEYVARNGRAIGPHMAIYHDACSGPRMLDMHVELAIPFEGAAATDEQVQVYDLPAVEEVACVIHEGPFEEIGHAYDALAGWIRQNGYRLVGPRRELYISCGEGDSSRYITEVQFPVAKEINYG
jgi:effector-binding domain-containing protein